MEISFSSVYLIWLCQVWGLNMETLGCSWAVTSWVLLCPRTFTCHGKAALPPFIQTSRTATALSATLSLGMNDGNTYCIWSFRMLLGPLKLKNDLELCVNVDMHVCSEEPLLHALAHHTCRQTSYWQITHDCTCTSSKQGKLRQTETFSLQDFFFCIFVHFLWFLIWIWENTRMLILLR